MTPLPPLTVVGLNLALGVGIGLVFGRHPARRALGAALVCTSWGMPMLADGTALPLTFLVGLGAVLYTLRGVDFLRSAPPVSPAARVFHMTAVFDTRLALKAPRRLDVAGVQSAAGWAAVAVAAFLIGVPVANRTGGFTHVALRWGAGAVFSIAAFESMTLALTAGWRFVGIEPPRLHDAPLRARSIGEFWGRRWNRIVGGWLRRNCFQPLARRGRPALGLLAAFLASAVIHAYLSFVCLGFVWAGVVAAFFLAQGFLVFAERTLGVARWRPIAGRVWTIGWLSLLSPLFTEPMIQLVDPLVGHVEPWAARGWEDRGRGRECQKTVLRQRDAGSSVTSRSTNSGVTPLHGHHSIR